MHPRRSWKVTTPPGNEPISLAAVKTLLGISSGDTSRDAELTALITAARQLAEAYTNRAFMTQTITLQLDAFPGLRESEPWWDGVRQGAIGHLARILDSPIVIPRPPLQSITTVTWYDASGTPTLINAGDLLVDAITEPGRLMTTTAWPTAARSSIAAHVVYVAGYGSNASDVPQGIVAALIAHIRDVWQRPNAAVSSEGIDNANTVYGLATGSVTNKAIDTGGLRGDASTLLDPYRITETGMVPAS